MNFRESLTETQERIFKAVDSYNHRLQRAIGTYGRESVIVKGMMEQANFSKHVKITNRDSGNIGTGKKALNELGKLNPEFIERTLEKITPENILLLLESKFAMGSKKMPESIKQIKARLQDIEDIMGYETDFQACLFNN